MTELESCELTNGEWAYGNGAALSMWVHRVSDCLKIQIITILLCSAMPAGEAGSLLH
jgi:hypothetical protein